MASLSSPSCEPTNTEILTAIDAYATAVEGQFNKIDERFNQVDQRLGKIEATMVTKEYLDDKLANLKGDMVVLMRKEDRKLAVLVDVLHERRVISDEDKKKILSLEPFPTSV